MYKVQSQNSKTNRWVNSGSYGSEQSAISAAKSVLKRPTVSSARVTDKNGSMVWIETNLFNDKKTKGLINFMKKLSKKDYKLLNL